MPVKKRTVSISKNTLPAIFRAVADILDEDTPLSAQLRAELVKRIPAEKKTETSLPGFFDIKTTDEQIRKTLSALSPEELIAVVQGYGLDSSHSVSKQKDLQKIIEFVVERRRGLLSRYTGFEHVQEHEQGDAKRAP